MFVNICKILLIWCCDMNLLIMPNAIIITLAMIHNILVRNTNRNISFWWLFILYISHECRDIQWYATWTGWWKLALSLVLECQQKQTICISWASLGSICCMIKTYSLAHKKILTILGGHAIKSSILTQWPI